MNKHRDHIFLMSLGFESLYRIESGNANVELITGKMINPRLKLIALALPNDPHEVKLSLHRKYAHKKTENGIFKLNADEVNDISDYLAGLFSI